MNSESADAMGEENSEKSALVPRLRFPEFDGIVSALPLAAVADLVGEKINVDQITSAQYVSTENLLPDFGDMNPAVKLPSVSSVTCFRPNDVLVSNIRPYLRKVWQANICGGASNDVLVIRPTERVGADYLAAILRSDLFIDYVMRGAKGVKMPRGEISMIQEFPVPCPSADEQQKIADCLSSLDELITAETQKLDALKTHKKGLMQQLFPREGETVPRLRFPMFRDAGEWVEIPLEEIGEIVTGKTPSTSDDSLWNGDIQFVTPTDISEEKYQWKTQRSVTGNAKTKALPLHSIMFTCIASIGKIALSVKPCITNQQINTLIPNKGHENEFVYYSLLNIVPLIKSTQANSTLPIINKTEFSKFTVPVPNVRDEQKRVADFLSSLDDLITAQNQKIDALKRHKQGLMQQLFPVMNEVLA